MPLGIIFITAPSADFKVVNRLLLDLRQSHDEYGITDFFHIATTKDSTDPDHDLSDVDNETTEPGDLTADDWINPWAGATLPEVSNFCLEAIEKDEQHGCPSLFLVLDEQGVEDKTVVLFDSMDDREMEELQLPNGDDFKKVRVPWHSVQSMWINLDIANMNFEEFCNHQEVPDHAGWYELGDMLRDNDWSEEEHGRRDEEMARFEAEGKV